MKNHRKMHHLKTWLGDDVVVSIHSFERKDTHTHTLPTLIIIRDDTFYRVNFILRSRAQRVCHFIVSSYISGSIDEATCRKWQKINSLKLVEQTMKRQTMTTASDSPVTFCRWFILRQLVRINSTIKNVHFHRRPRVHKVTTEITFVSIRLKAIMKIQNEVKTISVLSNCLNALNE